MTMTLVSTITVGTPVSSMSFTGIPQTGKDLYVVFSGRQSTSSDGLFMRFNNVSTGIYSYLNVRGLGSGTPTSGQATAQTFIYIGATANSTETANTFSSVAITVPNYAVVKAKTAFGDSVGENNATLAEQRLTAGYSTATTVITSLQLLTSGDTFVAGTTASLYMISTIGATGATVA